MVFIYHLRKTQTPTKKMEDFRTNPQIMKTFEEGFDGIPENLADLHQTKPTQVAYRSSRFERFTPKAGMDGDFIKIPISGGQNEFIDVSAIKVCFTVKIARKNGTHIPADHADGLACFVNGIGTAFFKNVTVRMNNQLLNPDDSYYAHKADIENKLYSTQPYKEHILPEIGYLEEKDIFDGSTDAFNPDAAARDREKTFFERYSWTNGSTPLEISSRIHSPLFDQLKPLIPGTNLEITFQKNSQNFILLTNVAQPHVILTDFAVEVKFDLCDPEIITDIILQTTKDPLKYQLRIPKIIPFPKAPNLMDLSIHNVFSTTTHLPRKIFVAMVKQTAEQGTRNEDPFAYQSFHVNSISLVIAGETRPRLELDTTLKRFNALCAATENVLQGESNGWNRFNYATRNAIVGWDLSPTRSGPLESFSMNSNENVSILIKLSAPNDFPITVLLYVEYEEEMLVDAHGTLLNQSFAIL